MDTKSILLDVIKHTSGLKITNIKVTGDDALTKLDAIDADRTVILNAKLHDAVPEFKGEFGMGNLGLLSNLTSLSNYATDATIDVVRQERNGVEIPTTLVFQDKFGSKDQYRFMSKELLEAAMRVATFKGAVWDIEVTPTQQRVAQLSEVASSYTSIEPSFSVKLEDGDLVFEVGSHEGGALGRRVFASNVTGDFSPGWRWPLDTFLSIVKLGANGSCVVKFSSQGACQIDVDSGIGIYSYILPAMSKT